MHIVEEQTAPKGQYREVLPDVEGEFRDFSTHDAHTWAAKLAEVPVVQGLQAHWIALWHEPFKGLTNDGNVISDLFHLEDHGIDVDNIVNAANGVLASCTPQQREMVSYPLNARQWRSWSNPEIYQVKYGVRLDEADAAVTEAVLRLLEMSMSLEGFEKARNAMRVNAFLGQMVNGQKVCNERSYNFLLFGTPSGTGAWGFSLFGHHLCMSFFVRGAHIMISPVFIGAEPNEIDEGPHKGITMMLSEESMGLKLMQSLSPLIRRRAQVYVNMHDEAMPEGRWNPADQRHVCGAYQDNRIVPYEGARVSDFDEEQIRLLLKILEEFLVYLPQRARVARLGQIAQHIGNTFFCWIGGFGDADAFYYRIHSPVVVVEFDHHSGVFLQNSQPAKYHIHTIARTPNGGDYGNALRDPADRLE